MANSIGHVALPVSDLDRSVGFYEQFVALKVIERITDTRGKAVRLGNENDEFTLMLIQSPMQIPHVLTGPGHLGVCLGARKQVDRLAAMAKEEGLLRNEPEQLDHPGYSALLLDPDGHQIELYFQGEDHGDQDDDCADDEMERDG